MGPKKGIALLLGGPEEGDSEASEGSNEGLKMALKDFWSAAQKDDWDEAAAAFKDAMSLCEESE